MPVYLKNKEIRELYLGSSRIREAYLGNRKIYQYDSAAPELLVTAPSGTAASAPTYTTSGTYRVQGTVMDSDSGVAAVYVNNTAAVISGTTWYCDISLTANSTATVQVYAIDNAGNRSAAVVRYVRYDSAPPSLSVSAPAGTSSSSPTYVQSDSAASYTVSGTVSDASGIASVTVNGQTAAISGNTWSKSLSGLATNSTHTITVVAKDKAGRTTTVNRYLRVEAYYQYASRIAGGTPQASLSALLQSDTEINKIVKNSSAQSVMKAHYASNMVSMCTSNFRVSLNTLLKNCGLQYWLFKGPSSYDATGSWVTTGIKFWKTSNIIHCASQSSEGGRYHSSGTSFNIQGYTKIRFVARCYKESGASWSGGIAMGIGAQKSSPTYKVNGSMNSSNVNYDANIPGSGIYYVTIETYTPTIYDIIADISEIILIP